MKTYIALFDILGFTAFIKNSDIEYIDRNIKELFLESQSAISSEKYNLTDVGFCPDLDKASVNCLHVSDSIIFWTKDKSEDAFKEIVNVCCTFYWRCMQGRFPVRGCLVLGEIEFNPFNIPIQNNFTFINSSLYGCGLIEAYKKAESQDWAGCYIDKSAVESVDELVIIDLIENGKIVYYPVPQKDGTNIYEHTISIIGYNINNVAFRNLAKGIEILFTLHMKDNPIDDSVRKKMFNTIKFLESFKSLNRY